MISEQMQAALSGYRMQVSPDSVVFTFKMENHDHELVLELEHVRSDDELVAALAYEISTFDFDRIRQAFPDMNSSDLKTCNEEFKKIYRTLCHLASTVNATMYLIAERGGQSE